MKITKKHNDGTVMFVNVDIGGVFLFDNLAYLKIDIIYPDDDGDYVNAICLNSGEASGFNAETRVKVVEAELIVEV